MPVPTNRSHFLPTVRLAAGASQDITVTGTSAQSTALGTAGDPNNILVRIVATTAVRYRSSTNPTATTTDTLLPANVVEFTEITPGDKLAVIQESAGGKFNITVCTYLND